MLTLPAPYKSILEAALQRVDALFTSIDICSSHNIDHIERVVDHARKALQRESIFVEESFAVLLAAVLHEATIARPLQWTHACRPAR